MSTTLIWFSLALFFLLVEVFTVTLYGSVIAMGCLAAGGVAYIMGGEFHWIQVVVCLVVVSVGSYLVPRFFQHSGKKILTGMDSYIGHKSEIKIIDGKPKVTLDGVDYLVRSEKKLVK